MPSMNRRSFLGALAATASGLLAPRVPELYEPRRVYSFPKTPTIWEPTPYFVATSPRRLAGVTVTTRIIPFEYTLSPEGYAAMQAEIEDRVFHSLTECQREPHDVAVQRVVKAIAGALGDTTRDAIRNVVVKGTVSV